MRRSLVCCLLAVAWTAAFGPARADAQGSLPEAYRVVDTWPSRPLPRPAGELSAPAGVDVADDGTVYVVDSLAANVHALAADGGGLAVLAGPGAAPGQLSGPRDVAWDAGRLYVTDTGNQRVTVLDAATGGALGAWIGLDRPWGIALLPGRAYVSSAASPLVYVMDRAGGIVARWGPGQAVDLPFVSPRGLAVDPAGTLYVADPGAGAIHVVAGDGRLIRSLDRDEAASGYREVWDVAADAVAVYGVVRRQLFAWQDPTGARPFERPGQYHFGAQGIGLGPGPGLVVTEQNDRTAFSGAAFYADRDRINALPARSVGTVPVAIGQLDGPRRLALTADGGAWLLDAWPRVQRWAAGGVPLGHLRAEGLVDVARAPGDDAYLVADNLVRRVAADGTERWRWAADPDGTTLVAAAADGGDLFAIDAGRERLLRFAADGTASTLPVAGLLTDLAVAGGQVAVLDRQAGAVRVLGPTGAELRRWPAPYLAQRLAAGLDGAAWYLLSGDHWVWKYAADGSARAAFDGAPGGTPVDLDGDRLGRVYVADGDGNRVLVHGLDPNGQPAVPPPPADRCRLAPEKTAAPASVLVGAPVTVTLKVSGSCPADSIEMDLVLALDRSGSMEGPKLAGAKSAAIGFTSELDFSRVRAGVVAFNQDATLVQQLTADRSAAVRAVSSLTALGLTNLAEPLDLALAELQGPRGRPGVQKVIVLMTDGRPEGSSGDAARAAAAAARAAGALVYVIGLGGDVDGALLGEMAGDPERYFETPTDAGLAAIYTLIARRLVTTTLLRRITVTDLVPANMRYAPGSAVPPPASWDGSALTWTLTDVPAGGFTLRYRLAPQVPGVWPTNVRADGPYLDGVGFSGTLVFPVPRVTVTALAPTPTPTPEMHRVFLPILHKSRCPQQRSDIVLVLDVSSSMLQPSPGSSQSKLEAAKQAAQAFLGFLGLPRDQAAVVGFHREATLAVPLTGDAAALRGGIAGLASAVGTRIDRGLASARAELGSPRRRPGNVPVVVLLTDGQPEGGTADLARAEARALRAAGATVFTIGLGADADGALLAELAGAPERYYFAPSQDDLRRIYESVAWALPCE